MSPSTITRDIRAPFRKHDLLKCPCCGTGVHITGVTWSWRPWRAPDSPPLRLVYDDDADDRGPGRSPDPPPPTGGRRRRPALAGMHNLVAPVAARPDPPPDVVYADIMSMLAGRISTAPPPPTPSGTILGPFPDSLKALR